MTDQDDARLIELIAAGPPETDGYVPRPFARAAVRQKRSTPRVSRSAWLVAACVVVVIAVLGTSGLFLGRPGIAVVPSPVVSPTLQPSPPTPAIAAALSVEAAIGEWCGSIGGCAYFAELRGTDGSWRAEFEEDRDEALAIGAGLPETLPAGQYTLILSSNLVSDEVLNGVRQLGPVNATCSVAFTVGEGQVSVHTRGAFQRETCSVTATISPIEPSPPADLDLAAAGWFRLVHDTPDQDSLAGFDLEVGTLDGRLARTYTARYGPLRGGIYRGALPVAVGPYGDTVLFAFWDGVESQLRAISVTSGKDELLLRRDDIIHAIALDARTDLVYVLMLDPVTRRETSILRFPRDRPTEQDSVAIAGADVPALLQIWKRMWITPDGRRLVVVDCPDACSIRTMPLSGGSLGVPRAIGSGDVVGVTNDAIVTVFDCGPPCPATRHDLSSGDSQEIGAFCERAVIASVRGQPALISDWPTLRGCRDSIYNVGRTDITTGERTGVQQLPDRARAVVGQNIGQGVAAPDGWFLLGPSGGLVGFGRDALVAPLLVRAEDGLDFQLPLLGPPRQP